MSSKSRHEDLGPQDLIDKTQVNSETGHDGLKYAMEGSADEKKLGSKEDYNDRNLDGTTNTRGKGVQERIEYDYHLERQTKGVEKFSRLGWIQLVVILIVEAIALGSLSIPAAFATLGMIAGVLICVGFGFVAIYTSYIVGQVKLKYPELVLLVGSHCLTGTIAFGTISQWPICSLVFGIVSAILLFLCAVPPSFSEMAILGYIDFVSILVAIFITLIATGINANKQPGGFSAVDWRALPPPETTFASAMVAVTNIVFAYSFAICQFSFMEEMHTPTDFPKSIWALGIIEIIIYTCTGAIGYAFVGQSVQSPALLSAGHTISRIAFGVALPVIFISGSINTVTVCRYIMDRAFKNSVIKYVNTVRGWSVWLLMIGIVSILAWVIAEAIPFFSDLLGLMSSLFISGFTIYLPGFLWLVCIRQGGFFQTWHNALLTVANILCILMGFLVLVGGTYGSVKDIIDQYSSGGVRGSFTCNPI